MQNELVRNLIGEILGTFIMVFLGVGAVATATLFGAHTGPFQVGLVWGLAVMIGIYCTRNLSAAHFNCAVSFAMLVTGNMNIKQFVVYIIGQFIGAILAAALLWAFFGDSAMANMIAEFGTVDFSQRGIASSIWCEVYPNTAHGVIPWGIAMLGEGAGIGLLVIVIFAVTSGENAGAPNSNLFPFVIGICLAMIICTVGPMTDAGLNPARDLGPRIVAIFAGWGSVAIEPLDIVVYTVGPLLGGAIGGWIWKGILSPAHKAAIKNVK